MLSPSRFVAAFTLFSAVAAVAGCARQPPAAVKTAPPDVIVTLPVVRSVTDAEDFTGRVEAFRMVEIRAQVTGELDQIHFKDGDFVNQGSPLFDIDRRIYEAQRNNARATLAQARAKLVLAKASLARAEESWKKGAIPKEDYDTKVADRDAGEAAVDGAQAALDLAERNLDYCSIAARYSGRMSRRLIDPGNIVQANVTPLSTLIVLNPIYIGFDIDEQTLERRREGIAAGKIPTAREATLNVQVGLGHQEGFPFTATITFSDNQLDAGTGTLHVRAEMRNPDLKPAMNGALAAAGGAASAVTEAEQKRLRRVGGLAAISGWAAADVELHGMPFLSPGMFVRVRLPMGQPHRALMIPEEALGSDQGQRVVLVVKEDNTVESRTVVLGPQDGQLRAIENGIKEGERVIVRGQQRVRPGGKVTPRSLDQPASAAPKADGKKK